MTTIDLIGSSPKFRALLTDLERIAPVDSAVLIQGETGTGKEVIARAIHEASPDFSSTAPTYKWGGAKWAEMSGTRF